MQQKLVPELSDIIKKYADYKEKQKKESLKNSELKEKKTRNKVHRSQLLKKIKEVTTKIELDQSPTNKKPNGSLDDKNREARKTFM